MKTTQTGKVRKTEWSRRVPYVYTGCLAHVEVVKPVMVRLPISPVSSSTTRDVVRLYLSDYQLFCFMSMSTRLLLNSSKMGQGEDRLLM